MSAPARDRFQVPGELAGTRLDRVLAALIPDLPRTRLREMIEDGRVSVEGAPERRPATRVREGSRLEIERVERDRSRPGAPAGAELAVVHADEHLVVIDKPAGMVVHPGPVVRGGTVAERAAEAYGPLPVLQAEDRPGIVHRLDAETTGLLVVARTAEAGAELLRQFREREVEKHYAALVHGVPRFDSEWIETPIGRDPRRADRMAVVAEGEGRAAETYYEVRERFGAQARLDCRPHTGRTHQIRVHLASIGHPVVADELYKGRGAAVRDLPDGAPRMQRHALHAERLAFVHPATGERVEFTAPLPDDLAACLAWLRAHG